MKLQRFLKKSDWIFGAVVVIVVSALSLISYFGPHPKPVFNISEHKNVLNENSRVQCLACHHPETGTDIKAHLKIDHPQKWKDEKFSCLGCHKLDRKIF